MTPPEIIHAEQIQAEEIVPISLNFSLGLAALAAVAIGTHLVWLAWRGLI